MSSKIIVKNVIGKEEKKWQQTTFSCASQEVHLFHRYPEKKQRNEM